MKTYRKRVVAFAVAGFLICGCASAGGGALQPCGPETDSRTRVEVRNFNWSDVTVYAVNGGKPIRLGMVMSMTTRTFELPEVFTMSGTCLRLLATGIGSRDEHESGTIVAERGDRIEWVLENDLTHSSYAVRHGGGR